MKIYKLAAGISVTPIIRFKRLSFENVEVCPHCRDEIREKSIWMDSETNMLYHSPCKDKGPIEHIKPKEFSWPELFRGASEKPEKECVLGQRGRAARMGVKEEDVDKGQLNKGIEIELEHTGDRDIAKQIALDHLSEISDYYTRLEALEEQAKKEGKFIEPDRAS